MIEPHRIIGDALLRAYAVTKTRGAHIIKSADISRADREMLVATGWLQEIARGWYMLVRPDVASGDSAAWYANFWDFARVYLEDHYGNDYCLSAESSLDLHVGTPIISKQIIVITKQGGGLRSLPYDTSLMMYSDAKNFPAQIEKKEGVQVMTLASALCRVAPAYFQRNARDAELALRSVRVSDDIIRAIMTDESKAAAARLIGAYEFLNEKDMASHIKGTLAAVGMLVSATNPFRITKPLLKTRPISPYAGRICAMWQEAREAVIKHFPMPPGLPVHPDQYMHNLDEIYQFDAYNSLSIEGYQVTNELINRVQDEKWNPDQNENDSNMRNAMAARGYYDAFQQVRGCVDKIIHGKNAATIVKSNLQIWYRNLFGASVQAGILTSESLFGYRNDRVFIRNSKHSPPPKEAVVDAMEAFFDCLQNEPHPGVNAVLGHYFFVYIHPYMDGNGRIGRFIMNALLASGGYPWTVIRVDNRRQYINALENTHSCFDLTEFALFVKKEMMTKIEKS